MPRPGPLTKIDLDTAPAGPYIYSMKTETDLPNPNSLLPALTEAEKAAARAEAAPWFDALPPKTGEDLAFEAQAHLVRALGAAVEGAQGRLAADLAFFGTPVHPNLRPVVDAALEAIEAVKARRDQAEADLAEMDRRGADRRHRQVAIAYERRARDRRK